jgi:hypothetical protein
MVKVAEADVRRRFPNANQEHLEATVRSPVDVGVRERASRPSFRSSRREMHAPSSIASSMEFLGRHSSVDRSSLSEREAQRR